MTHMIEYPGKRLKLDARKVALIGMHHEVPGQVIEIVGPIDAIRRMLGFSIRGQVTKKTVGGHGAIVNIKFDNGITERIQYEIGQDEMALRHFEEINRNVDTVKTFFTIPG